jgi:beta-phosphoglucomutase-like phosphatase (HAD superfamily)
MTETREAGLRMGVCTTSNELAARAVTEKMLPDIPFEFVLAGDVVRKKKPDPEIYRLALTKTGLSPEEAFVVEDSRNGMESAKGAALGVVVTTNGYTENEDVSAGDIIVTCLGDPDGERGSLRKGKLEFDGVLRLEQVLRYFSD